MQTGGITWQVPLGRRDGLVSQASDTANLPAFNDPINVQIRKFTDKGLNSQDLVALSGKLNTKNSLTSYAHLISKWKTIHNVFNYTQIMYHILKVSIMCIELSMSSYCMYLTSGNR